MLNPDGVIVGNNRCSLSGKDLNRQYRTVMRESYPSVWHTKLMIRRLLEECGVAIYCDLHAHSRKHNIFVYGCESKRTASQARLSEQVFPLMLHKNAADKVVDPIQIICFFLLCLSKVKCIKKHSIFSSLLKTANFTWRKVKKVREES